MDKLSFEKTITRNGVATTISVKGLPYDTVEFAINRKVLDDDDCIVQETKLEMYPSESVLIEMLEDFVNYMKGHIDERNRKNQSGEV